MRRVVVRWGSERVVVKGNSENVVVRGDTERVAVRRGVRHLVIPAFCPPTMTVPLALTVTLVSPAEASIDAVVTAMCDMM